MRHSSPRDRSAGRISRRQFLFSVLAGGSVGTAGVYLRQYLRHWERDSQAFVAKASSYSADLASIIRDGLRELGILPEEIHGKRILLKPNLIEAVPGTTHICTQPELVSAALEVFMGFGAASVIVGEGSGNCRDTPRLLQETGMDRMLVENKVCFADLNDDDLVTRRNVGRLSGLETLTLPATVEQVDWIVSMPKMKTHHWAGVTLSMKNLFGLMPGIAYGWPKNVFHCVGIHRSILDINATIRPHFAIVDGIIGMEGDGPIMGTPKHAGAVVMGRDLAAVDATCARIMGIDPVKVPYLYAARGWLGTVSADKIDQRGESIAAVRHDFQLMDFIPAHTGLRLAIATG